MADQSHSLADARCNPTDAENEARLAIATPESQDQDAGELSDLAVPRTGRGAAMDLPIEPRRSGRLSMSRRQLVSAAMVSPAVVMNAIVENGIEEDPALDLWRQWRRALAASSEALAKWDAVDGVMPKKFSDLRDQEDVQIWNRLVAEMEREPLPLSPETEKFYESQFQDLESRQKVREEGRAACGVTRLKESVQQAEAKQYAAIRALGSYQSTSPIAVAARLHIAMDWELDDLGDWATRMAVSIVQSLLPFLPKEMVDALEMQMAGMGCRVNPSDSISEV